MLADPLDRRRFLIGLAKGAAAAAWAGSGLGLATTAWPSRASTLPDGPIEILRSPIVLRRGDVLADRRFQLAPDFAWTDVMAAVYGAAPDITIRNVEIVGAASWQSRWNAYHEPWDAPPGINSGMCGIRLQGAPRAVIENVTVRGFPRAGVYGFGLDDGVIQDVIVDHCFLGLHVDYYQPNRNLTIQRVHVQDLWGPGPDCWPGVGGARSAQRPGGFMGSDGVVLQALRQSVVYDCAVLGEQFGSFKLVNPQDTEVSGLNGVSLMIQGTSDLDWKIDTEPSINTVVRNCTLARRLGSGPVAKSGHTIQISWHVRDLLIENCTLIAAGKNGHGIQFAVDAHGRIQGCTFDGFNGMAGIEAACALELVEGSTANADFADVNVFVNQRNIQHSS